ncbi:MAG: hypothetical protein J0I69_03275 [Altererythrobacter sp.]|mgnify:CR=1 FL=1|nr:hypothetical protein [Altererythrobacter sp.]OJU61018.1 MAG: hypothetical protein BGO08_12995 [Altererythrobacter sp. 66-12]
MIISGKDFPNIGHIRVKSHGDGRNALTVTPPTPGPLQGHEPAHSVEVEASDREVERIRAVAPHLIAEAAKVPFIVSQRRRRQ